MPSDMYRQAASILVLRPSLEGGEYQLLLLHKPRKRDAWQLPQGGMEQGEDVPTAALRELHEEAGITTCTVLMESAHVYEYAFPATFRRFRPDNISGQRIRFVLGHVTAETAVTVDQKEIDAFAWVNVCDLGRYITRKVYCDLIKRLYDQAVGLLPA